MGLIPVIILGADDTGLCGQFSRGFLAHDMGFMYRFCYGFFFHVTWELCADLTGRYFSILLTDDMGISDQIYPHDMGLPGRHRRPRWEMEGKFL